MNKKYALHIVICFALVFFFAASLMTFEMGKEEFFVHAIVETSPRYYLQGAYTWQEVSAQPNNYSGVGTGDTLIYGSTSIAKIHMDNKNVSGSQNLVNGAFLAMQEYKISVTQISETKKITSESFILKKNGVELINYPNMGTGSKLLFSSSLQDGKYDIVYQCSYKPSVQLLVRFVFSFSFEVDNTPPSYILTSNGSNISSGTYTNGNVYYKMVDSNPYSVYVKSPTDSSFVLKYAVDYTCPSNLEGLWKFKGRDLIGNESVEASVYIDKTKPLGNIENEQGVIITKAYYNKKIKYECSDNISLDRCEYKEGSGAYQTYLGEYLQNNVKYTFRGIDKAGNISDEKSITIDTVLPEIEFVANGVIVSHGAEVKGSFVRAQALDLSGIDSMYVKRPNQTIFSSYVMNSELVGEGKYEFYAEDKAGNKSATRSITIDNTPPTLALFSGTTPLAWGSPTNSISIKATVADNLSEENQMYVKKPGESNYQAYSGEGLYSQGQYYFYAKDKAGNISETKEVLVDQTPPDIFIRNNQGIIENTIYFKGGISLEAEDLESQVLEIRYKAPLLSEFIVYPSGTNLSLEGEYSFYAIDNAGNESLKKYISIDNSPPIGKIYVQYGTLLTSRYTNSQFITYHANDSMSGVETCYVKRPGNTSFETYLPGGQLVVEGEYFFYAKDGVGNISEEIEVCVDRKAPVPKMLSNGEIQHNGDFSNSSFLIWGEDEVGISKIYLKESEELNYYEYEEEYLCDKEGVYSFYVEDYAKNRSETNFFHIDKTSPFGLFHNEYGQEILSTIYSQSFKYLAFDNLQLERVEWKKGDGLWEIYTGEILSSLESCKYYFRCFDRAENMSLESEMFFDNVKPRVILLDPSNSEVSKNHINLDFVSVSFEDSESGVYMGYIKYPGESEGTQVESSVRLQIEGIYIIWCVDLAGNSSQERELIIDRTPPIASVKTQGSGAAISATYANSPFYFVSYDLATSNLFEYIKLPNSIEWVPHVSGHGNFVPEVEGLYQYKSIDLAGNQSNITSITYDITKPIGSIYISFDREPFPTAYSPLDDSHFVRAQVIVYSSNDEDIQKLEVLLPGASEYVQYIPLLPLSEEGEYAFRGIDFAGNISNISLVSIDRTPVIPFIPEETGGEIHGTFSIAAEGAIRLLVNGIPISKGQQIQTIYLASYEIYTEDEAGNTYVKTITSKNMMGFSLLSFEEWWEATIDSIKYSFSDEQTATEALVREEEKLVIPSFWRTEDLWNMGIPMESVDSKNAKPGTFYIYKSPSDKESLVAYFTLFRLREVLLEYAKQGLKKYKYYEKEPLDGYNGKPMYYPLTEKAYAYTNIPTLGGLQYFIDGQEYPSLSDLEEGEYLLEIRDNFQNTFSLRVTLLTDYAKVNLKMGSEDSAHEPIFIEAQSSLSPYYFASNTIVAISEKAQGNSIFFIKDNNQNILFEGSIDTQYELAASGIYHITTTNRLGQGQQITVYISKDVPKTTFVENEISKKLNIAIENSSQSFAKILNIKIYKSQDGESFIPLQFDDYGNEINTLTLQYSFRSTGYFKVIIEDLFRYSNTQILAEAYYKKLAPVGTLSGIEDNGITNQKVKFYWTDEARATIEKEGTYETEYTSGSEITEDGKYTLILKDYDNNTSIYSFTIKTTPPEVYVTGVSNGGTTKDPVSFVLAEGSSIHLATRNGEPIQYTPGSSLTTPGMYAFEFIDAAGNKTTYSFEITEKASTSIFIYLGIAAGIISIFALFVFLRRRTSSRKPRRPRLRTE